MVKEDVLAALRRAEGQTLSGEELSRSLGVSRAAFLSSASCLRLCG